MAKETQAQKIRMQIEVWRDTAKTANEKIEELNAKLRAVDVPPAPPAGSALTVEVQFALNPNVYKFLIMSVPGKGYYTTGTLDHNSYFATWPAMWAYFNSDDVVRRSEFHVLLQSPFPGNRYGGVLDRREEF